MRISILCPTKGRINRARLMRDSALSTAERPRRLEFIFCIDNNDYDTIRRAYKLIVTTIKCATVATQLVVNDHKLLLSEKWNVCWKYASGDIFMLGADDIIFRTKDWDKKVIEKFLEIPDRIAYVYTDDGFRNRGRDPKTTPRGFGTHGFVHRNWTDVLGYFAPPYFERRCTDSWLDNISRMILPNLKRHIGIQDVLIEHMFWMHGKSEVDETYKEQYRLGHAYKTQWRSRVEERQGEAAKLRKFIEEFDEGNSDKSA